MDSLFEHYKKTGYLHHAHVVEGVHDVVAPLLLRALEQNLGIETKGNPDVAVEYYESLGVANTRNIKTAEAQTPFSGTKKIFIIGAKSITRDAQNAFLKIFEEPTLGTHFFIIIPRSEILLPTVLSRVLVVPGVFREEDEAKIFAEKFLDAGLETRFALIKKIAEKKAGETIDRELFRQTVDHIERILYSRTAGKRDDATSSVFREIFQAKTYLADSGSSPKMLLEHIAMVIPR